MGWTRRSPSTPVVRAYSIRNGAVNTVEQTEATAATATANPRATARVHGLVTRTTSHPNARYSTTVTIVATAYTPGTARMGRYHPRGVSGDEGSSSGRMSASATRAGHSPRTTPRAGKVTAADVCRFTHRQSWAGGLSGRARVGSPAAHLSRSSARAAADSYRSVGSFSRHLRAIADRSRSAVGFAVCG